MDSQFPQWTQRICQLGTSKGSSSDSCSMHASDLSLLLSLTGFCANSIHPASGCQNAQEIDSGCGWGDEEGFPELCHVLIPSHQPAPSITVICGLPLDHINQLFSGYLLLMI